MVVVLLLPYSLYRWASGREALVGTAVVAVPVALGLASSGSLGDVVGGTTVVVASFALGAAMRYRAVAHQREVQQVRTHERGELARELHDTVAHHVSAIAIQAQAGRAVAATNPGAALEALAVIEAEASRTLTEMRAVVRVLREGEADFAPQRGDRRPGRAGPDEPLVQVRRSGTLVRPAAAPAGRGLPDLPGGGDQRDPARGWTPPRSRCRSRGTPDVVRLRVHDDGHAARPGYQRRLRPGRDGRTGQAARRHVRGRAGPGRRLDRLGDAAAFGGASDASGWWSPTTRTSSAPGSR